MTEEKKSPSYKKFMLENVTLSFVSVFEKKEQLTEGVFAYEITALIPKSDVEQIKKIKAAILAAAKDFFGEDRKKWPKDMHNCLRDGDDVDYNGYKDHFFVRASNKKGKPQIFGPNGKPLLDQEALYAGCKGVVCVDFAGYDTRGSRGVTAYLMGVMKLKDGDRLDSSLDGEKVFSKYAVEDEDADDMFNGSKEDEGNNDAGTEDDSFFG